MATFWIRSDPRTHWSTAWLIVSLHEDSLPRPRVIEPCCAGRSDPHRIHGHWGPCGEAEAEPALLPDGPMLCHSIEKSEPTSQRCPEWNEWNEWNLWHRGTNWNQHSAAHKSGETCEVCSNATNSFAQKKTLCFPAVLSQGTCRTGYPGWIFLKSKHSGLTATHCYSLWSFARCTCDRKSRSGPCAACAVPETPHTRPLDWLVSLQMQTLTAFHWPWDIVSHCEAFWGIVSHCASKWLQSNLLMACSSSISSWVANSESRMPSRPLLSSIWGRTGLSPWRSKGQFAIWTAEKSWCGGSCFAQKTCLGIAFLSPFLMWKHCRCPHHWHLETFGIPRTFPKEFSMIQNSLPEVSSAPQPETECEFAKKCVLYVYMWLKYIWL